MVFRLYNMKKLLTPVFAVLMCASYAVGQVPEYHYFTAQVPSGQVLKFLTYGDDAEVYPMNTDVYTGSGAAYDNLTGRLVLPDSVNDDGVMRRVAGVGHMAFRMCSGLRSVVIPNAVRYLGQHAFAACTQLDSVRIGTGLDSLGMMVFGNCINLTVIEVDSGNAVFDSREGCNAIIRRDGDTLVFGCRGTTIPSSVRHIGADAFGNNSPYNLTIPEGVISIGKAAFSGCQFDVVLPNSVDSIAEEAFAFSYFTTLQLNEGLRVIGKGAFSHLYNITELTIPRSVQYIGHQAFGDCRALREVHYLADSCAVMGGVFFGYDRSAFCQCTTLQRIVVGASVRYLPDYAFYGLDRIEAVALPQSLRRTGDHVFGGCTGLRRVDYDGPLADWCSIDFGEGGNPLQYAHHLYLDGVLLTGITASDSLRVVNRFALAGCTDLEHADLPAGIESVGFGAFLECTALRSLYLPPSLLTVGGRAFEGCTSLQTLAVDSCTAFGIHAFGGCSALQRIDSRSSFPAIAGVEAFDGVDVGVPVHVPQGSRERYLSAWAPLWNFIESSGPEGITEAEAPRITVENGEVSADGMEVRVYDAMGRIIGKGVCVPLPKSGVYIVSANGYSTKIVVAL